MQMLILLLSLKIEFLLLLLLFLLMLDTVSFLGQQFCTDIQVSSIHIDLPGAICPDQDSFQSKQSEPVRYTRIAQKQFV